VAPVVVVAAIPEGRGAHEDRRALAVVAEAARIAEERRELERPARVHREQERAARGAVQRGVVRGAELERRTDAHAAIARTPPEPVGTEVGLDDELLGLRDAPR